MRIRLDRLNTTGFVLQAQGWVARLSALRSYPPCERAAGNKC